MDDLGHQWEPFGHDGIACPRCGTVIYRRDVDLFTVHRWGSEYSARQADPIPTCEPRPVVDVCAPRECATCQNTGTLHCLYDSHAWWCR